MKKVVGLMVTLLVMVSLCCLWAVQAEAAPIPGLYDTGVNSSNALLPAGSLDTYYTLTAAPGFTVPRGTIVYDPSSFINYTWVSNTSSSQWIGLQTEANFYSPGLYKYDITFDLTGLNPATAVITGEFAADNNAAIFLNGNNTGVSTPTVGFQSFTSFTISSGFISGVNTLEFQVDNLIDPVETNSPTGLQVNDLRGTANAVSEPVSLLLFGAGLVGLAAIGRRTKK